MCSCNSAWIRVPPSYKFFGARWKSQVQILSGALIQMKILFTNKNRERNRKEEIIKWFSEYKKTVSCSKCGEKKQLEFHHRIPVEKKDTISALVRNGKPMERILDEIKKCDILCSRCHKKEHNKF